MSKSNTGTNVPLDQDKPPPSRPTKDFPVALFIVSLIALVLSDSVATQMGEALDRSLPLIGCRKAMFLIGMVSVLGFCTYWLFACRFREKRVSIGMVLVILFCGHYLGHQVHTMLLSTAGKLGYGLVLFLILVGCLYAVHHLKDSLMKGRSLQRRLAKEWLKSDETNQIKVLIMTVSMPNYRPEVPPGKKKCDADKIRFIHKEGQEIYLSCKNLDQDIAELNKASPFLNWQQILRGIIPHLNHLEKIYLVGSHKSLLGTAKEFLELYPELKTTEIVATEPIAELEDFDLVAGRYREILSEIRPKYPKSTEIAIDVTGGFKIVSIVASIMTLNREVLCQYVQSVGSNAEEKRIQAYIYDFRWDPSLGGH